MTLPGYGSNIKQHMASMADHSNEQNNDSCITNVGHADMSRRESEESVNAPIAAMSEAFCVVKKKEGAQRECVGEYI
jgi:hypothetical protein